MYMIYECCMKRSWEIIMKSNEKCIIKKRERERREISWICRWRHRNMWSMPVWWGYVCISRQLRREKICIVNSNCSQLWNEEINEAWLEKRSKALYQEKKQAETLYICIIAGLMQPVMTWSVTSTVWPQLAGLPSVAEIPSTIIVLYLVEACAKAVAGSEVIDVKSCVWQLAVASNIVGSTGLYMPCSISLGPSNAGLKQLWQHILQLRGRRKLMWPVFPSSKSCVACSVVREAD